MTEKSRKDQANRRQKHGLVWRNRKKNSQIIKDYFYLPFFLIIIVCDTQNEKQLYSFKRALYCSQRNIAQKWEI